MEYAPKMEGKAICSEYSEIFVEAFGTALKVFHHPLRGTYLDIEIASKLCTADVARVRFSPGMRCHMLIKAIRMVKQLSFMSAVRIRPVRKVCALFSKLLYTSLTFVKSPHLEN